VPRNYLHLEDHGIVLPEKSEAISKIIGGDFELCKVACADLQRISGKDELVVFDADLKNLVSFDTFPVKVDGFPGNGCMGDQMQTYAQYYQETHKGIKQSGFDEAFLAAA